MKNINKFKNLFITFLFFVPLFLGVLYVYLFGVNVLFWDQWLIVPLFDKYFSGTLTFDDFYSQLNEHRMVFPRLVMLLLGLISKYNSIIEMYFIQFLLFISLCVIFIVIKKQFEFKFSAIPLSFILIPFLVFSWRQCENMLLGIQINFLLVLLSALLAFYFIYLSEECSRFSCLFFTGAILWGTVSSFSCAMGLLIWPSGLLQILISPVIKKKKLFYSLSWISVCLLEWLLYFTDYRKPENHPDTLLFLKKPLIFFQYFFTCLGGSLSWDKITAPVIGIIIILTFLICLFFLYKNKSLKYNSFWLATGGFSLLIVLSISVGRCGFGVEQALVCRYATFSILFLVSLYVMLLYLIKKNKKFFIKVLCNIIVFIILLSMPFTYKCGILEGERIKAERIEALKILLTYETQPDEVIEHLFPFEDIGVRDRAFILKKYNYNVFSKSTKNH